MAAADDVELVADFVRRLRRVALHPLALDPGPEEMPGGLLRHYMQVPTEVEEHDDGTVTMRSPLPDEVQFESLATRVRAFALERDRLYWPKAFDALDRLSGVDSTELRDEWTQATDRTARARAFYTGYQVGDDGTGDSRHLTDVELAFAWLYEDVAHSDEVSTGHFGVEQRFKAAVSVFAHMAVVALETLEFINQFCELGVIALPVGTFSDPVVVTACEVVFRGVIIETAVGDDLSDPAIAASVPAELSPAFDIARQMIQQRSGDPESEVVSMSIQRANGPDGSEEIARAGEHSE